MNCLFGEEGGLHGPGCQHVAKLFLLVSLGVFFGGCFLAQVLIPEILIENLHHGRLQARCTWACTGVGVEQWRMVGWVRMALESPVYMGGGGGLLLSGTFMQGDSVGPGLLDLTFFFFPLKSSEISIFTVKSPDN